MYRFWKDYHGDKVFTIDPMMAKDIDDVLQTVSLPYGRAEMVIHIANVSHFIKKKYHINKETQ